MHTKELTGAERRTEARVHAGDEVRLRHSSILSESFTGRLLDKAPHGFRARHNCLTLSSGEFVNFEFQDCKGTALTVWTRIIDGRAESGFRILPETNT